MEFYYSSPNWLRKKCWNNIRIFNRNKEKSEQKGRGLIGSMNFPNIFQKFKDHLFWEFHLLFVHVILLKIQISEKGLWMVFLGQVNSARDERWSLLSGRTLIDNSVENTGNVRIGWRKRRILMRTVGKQISRIFILYVFKI